MWNLIYVPIIVATMRATIAHHVQKRIKGAVPVSIEFAQNRLSRFFSGNPSAGSCRGLWIMGSFNAKLFVKISDAGMVCLHSKMPR